MKLSSRTPPAADLPYIGLRRATPVNYALAQRFVPHNPKRPSPAHLVAVKGDPIEHYARWLLSSLFEDHHGVREALLTLPPRATLYGAACDREAVPYGPTRPQPSTRCHGDAISSVWLALHDARWTLATIDRRGRSLTWAAFQSSTTDYDARMALIRHLYALAFGSPMLWGNERP